MNKKQFIKAIAMKTGSTQKMAENFVNAFWSTVENANSNSENVTFVGYGTFGVKSRSARTTMNPKTKQPMMIAAKKVPVFKAGKNLKAAVN